MQVGIGGFRNTCTGLESTGLILRRMGYGCKGEINRASTDPFSFDETAMEVEAPAFTFNERLKVVSMAETLRLEYLAQLKALDITNNIEVCRLLLRFLYELGRIIDALGVQTWRDVA
mgnify:CR=1 FL=1